MTDTDKIIRELESLKQSIEDTKTVKAQAEGRLEAELERLSSDFGIQDESKAGERIKQLEDEENRLTEQLTKRYSLLRENYEW